LFGANLTDVILEIDFFRMNISFDNLKPGYLPPKHYYIKELPDEFYIIITSNDEIKELKYFCHGKDYSIKLTNIGTN